MMEPRPALSCVAAPALNSTLEIAQKYFGGLGGFMLIWGCHNLSLNPSAKWSFEISSNSFFDKVLPPRGGSGG